MVFNFFFINYFPVENFSLLFLIIIGIFLKITKEADNHNESFRVRRNGKCEYRYCVRDFAKNPFIKNNPFNFPFFSPTVDNERLFRTPDHRAGGFR